MSKRLIFESIIDVEDFDVIILTETWWTTKVTSGLVQFDKYNIVARSDKTLPPDSKKYGGGAAILVKKNINFHSPIDKNIEN